MFNSKLDNELKRAKVNDAGARQHMYQNELKNLLGIMKSAGLSAGKVLDIGCGGGEFLSFLQEKGWEAYGTEVRPEVREIAEKRGIIFNDYNYDAGYFDLIIMRGVIQHIENIEEILAISYKLLKQGGILAILANPDTGSICYRLFKEMPALTGGQHRTPVYRAWRKKELISFLDRLGFNILSTRSPYIGTPYAHPSKDVASFILRLFGVRKVFPFWGNMIEVYSIKQDGQI
jgi:SAM-dependent methyltransferase